jgi:hypothetical protein
MMIQPDPPWYEKFRFMDRIVGLIDDEKNPYRLFVKNEDGLEFFIDAYPAKLYARTGLLMLLEAVWGYGKLDKYSARVLDSQGHVVYEGSRFLPSGEYEIVAAPEIWMGIKTWLAEKDGEKYVLITVLDRLVPVPMDYELLVENKFAALIFTESDGDVRVERYTSSDWMDAISYARNYVNENRGPWDEIIVISDIGGVYEVITKVDEPAENVSWSRCESIPCESSYMRRWKLKYVESYIEREDGLRLRHYWAL